MKSNKELTRQKTNKQKTPYNFGELSLFPVLHCIELQNHHRVSSYLYLAPPAHCSTWHVAQSLWVGSLGHTVGRIPWYWMRR